MTAPNDRSAALRRRAEALVRSHRDGAVGVVPPQLEEDPLALVEELRIYQAELELQNEELKEAQHRTAEELARFTRLFEALPIPLLVIDHLGLVEQTNSRAAERFGFRKGQWLRGHSLSRLAVPEDAGRLVRAVGRICTGAEARVERLDLRVADGVMPAEVHLAPMPAGTAEEAGRALMMVVDRSAAAELERRDAELKEAELKFRTMTDWSSDWEYWITADGHFVHMTPSAEAITGHPPDAFNADPGLLERIVHPDDRTLWQQHLHLHLHPHANAVGDEAEVEYRILASDGAERWVCHRCRPLFDDAGCYLGRRVSVRDITARRQTEQALAAARREIEAAERLAHETIDALGMQLCVLDERGVVLIVNRAWREFAEANPPVPERYGVGRNYLEVSGGDPARHDPDLGGFAGQLRQVLDGALPGFQYEYSCHSPTEERWFIAHVSRFAQADPVRVVVAHEEVTERWRLTQTIDEQRRTLQAVMDHAPVAIQVFDPDGRVLLANPQAEALLGRPIEDVPTPALNRAYGVFLFGSDTPYPTDRMPLVRALSGEVSRVEDMEVRRLDGSRVLLQVIGAPIRDEQGRITSSVVVFQDILSRVEAEQQIRSSERHLRRIGDNLPSGAIYQLQDSPDGGAVFRYISSGIERMFGVSQARVLADANALRGLIHPDDRQRVIEAELESARTLTIFDQQFRHYTTDGRLRWIHVRSMPYRAEEGGVQWDGVVLDITEQKRGEAEIVEARDAAEQSAEALARHNRFLRLLTEVSRAVSASLDLGEVLETLLREILKILQVAADSAWIYERERDELVCRHAVGAVAGRIRGQRLPLGVGITGWVAEQRRSVVVRDTRHDPRHYKSIDEQTGIEIRSILAVPLAYRNELHGVLVCVDEHPDRFDQGALQMLEALAGSAAVAIHNARLFGEMAALREQAENASRAKTAFLANMSHELRTPLNGVLGYAQLLLQDRALGEGQHKAAAAIQRNAANLLRLLNEVLDITDLESGGLRLHPERFSLPGLLRDLAESCEPLVGSRGMSFRLAGGRAPEWVMADPVRLRQLLDNLLENAFKFAQMGTVTLACNAGPRPQGRATLLFSVTDQGHGILPDELLRLFRPFGKIQAGQWKEGPGLGLSLCRALANQMGGEFGLTTRAPGGDWVATGEGGPPPPDQPQGTMAWLRIEVESGEGEAWVDLSGEEAPQLSPGRDQRRPGGEALVTLRRLCAAGDVDGLLAAAQRLRGEHPGFARRLAELAETIQLDELEDWLDQQPDQQEAVENGREA
jgi:PAS domain S-box-containing protein